MTSKPLIIEDGLLQQADQERVKLNLNIGNPTHIDVTSNSVNISTMFHTLQAAHTIDVKFIYGGSEGDLILLKGINVKLKTGGNIKLATTLTMLKAVMLLYTDGLWIPVMN